MDIVKAAVGGGDLDGLTMDGTDFSDLNRKGMYFETLSNAHIDHVTMTNVGEFGGITATVLWEVTRRLLVWYFSTLSQVNVVYGSLTTAIVVLLSLEIAATLVLFGAQVIAQYERLDREQRVPTP
jgi:hypothetical protein